MLQRLAGFRFSPTVKCRILAYPLDFWQKIFAAGEDGEHRLTLQYTVETGENTYTVYSFTTLSIEEVTLELLSPDAITGATPFRFVLDQQ